MSKTATALQRIDLDRVHIATHTERSHKEAHGQFMTQAPVAEYMAGLLDISQGPMEILDAGAGIGSLSIALMERVPVSGLGSSITAVEMDRRLFVELQRNLCSFENISATCENVDFAEFAVNKIQFNDARFTHAIINPPYKKIKTNSHYRRLGQSVGIETVNLYSLFSALCVLLLKQGGQLVAIIPRSFCNGPYYKPFRELILRECSIEHLHLFGSRKSVFSDDAVLQENIIIKLKRGAKQGRVIVSHSTNQTFNDVQSKEYDFDSIVDLNHDQLFFHVPNDDESKPSFSKCGTLQDLDFKVSTGPIVDFRAKDDLCDRPCDDAVPLLYPMHFASGAFIWPVLGGKKPNAIRLTEQTRRSVYQSGWYVVVRRFSSKEEPRRIIPRIVNPDDLEGYEFFAFENHFNVFHDNKKGLDSRLAHGLTAYLSSKIADRHFREFNGHTQVNATDLRNMPYPKKSDLIALGERVSEAAPCSTEIETMIEKII